MNFSVQDFSVLNFSVQDFSVLNFSVQDLSVLNFSVPDSTVQWENELFSPRLFSPELYSPCSPLNSANASFVSEVILNSSLGGGWIATVLMV